MRGNRSRRRKFWLIWCLLLLLIVASCFLWFDQSLQPALRQVATIRLKQMATQAINQAITKQFAQANQLETMMEWKFGADGKVQGAVFNQQMHAQITADCVRVVEHTLQRLQQVPEHVPLGMLFDSSLLSQFGPRLQVTLLPAGIVQAEMGSEWKEAGINTMMLEIYVRIQTELRVLVGFDAASITIRTRIPLTYAVFQGDVPNYYFQQKPPSGMLLPPGGVIAE